MVRQKKEPVNIREEMAAMTAKVKDEVEGNGEEIQKMKAIIAQLEAKLEVQGFMQEKVDKMEVKMQKMEQEIQDLKGTLANRDKPQAEAMHHEKAEEQPEVEKSPERRRWNDLMEEEWAENSAARNEDVMKGDEKDDENERRKTNVNAAKKSYYNYQEQQEADGEEGNTGEGNVEKKQRKKKRNKQKTEDKTDQPNMENDTQETEGSDVEEEPIWFKRYMEDKMESLANKLKKTLQDAQKDMQEDAKRVRERTGKCEQMMKDVLAAK